MQAILLVGGFGTRLRPLTLTRPKQMLPLVDRPMIEHVVDNLAKHGVGTVVLALGYRSDAFRSAYPDGRCRSVDLLYAEEPEPLDTAGALRFAYEASRHRSHSGREPLVVANGDVIADADITGLLDLHHRCGAEATIHLTRVEDPSRYGAVLTDENGAVTAFLEKPDPGSLVDVGEAWVNAGTYVISTSVVERIPEGRPVSLERETFPALVERRALAAMRDECYWIDAGTPEAYLRAQVDILAGRRRRRLSPGGDSGAAVNAPSGRTGARAPGGPTGSPRPAPPDARAGESASPHEGASPRPVGACDDKRNSPPRRASSATAAVENASLHESFLGDGATVGLDAVIERSAVMAGARVGARARVVASSIHAGAVIGDAALVEDSVVAAGAIIGACAELTGGTMIGEAVKIAPGAALVGARVPDDAARER